MFIYNVTVVIVFFYKCYPEYQKRKFQDTILSFYIFLMYNKYISPYHE